MKKRVLITGSGGLIGSESVRFFAEKEFLVVGIDNDMRSYFFGEEASTKWNNNLLKEKYSNFIPIDLDIRNEKTIEKIFEEIKFDLIIHTAAQPSHDWAAKEPITDFTVNANGTLNLLEAFNELPLVELEKRWEIEKGHPYWNGIDEFMSIDQSKHSVFGASKVAADIMVQEYGRYFGLKTGTFRGGCLTGPQHSGAQLHGFLAYLAKCVATGQKYTIFGYKGKQVRDNIHSFDLVNMFWHFYQNPRQGEVYNAGGARHSNISMLEAIEKLENILGKKAVTEYNETNRVGDHIWYISDVSKFKKHYPDWDFKYGIDDILKEICESGHF